MPTLTIAGTISFPLSDEASPPSRPFDAQLVYDERSVDDVKVVGAQVDLDLMSSIADAKAAYVEAISGDGVFKINGATQTIPLDSAGGFWLWFNPGGGLTGMTVTTTANATFRVYLFA